MAKTKPAAAAFRHARCVGTYKGRRVYVVPVRVLLNNSRQLRTVAKLDVEVTSHTPADAANYVRDSFADRPETEVFAYGPNGGETYRYVGWESAIGHRMFSRPRDTQLQLTLQ